MRIVFLTRTSRPSGALIAKSLIDSNKNVVAIIAEERSQLLKKGNKHSILLNSISQHGFSFTLDRLFEFVNIKLHFLLRKTLTSKIFRSCNYLSIEELVLDKRIPYYVVNDHNSTTTEELIRSFSPELIVITNTRLLQKNILNIPKFGCLNLHLSALPKYAGLDSVFWTLFYAEKEIGVTVHFVSQELDRGDIILQKSIPVASADNGKTLYAKALRLGAVMMPEAVTLIENHKAKPIKQELRFASYFKWPTKQQRQVLRKKLKRRLRIRHEGPIRILHIITRLIKGGAQENTLLTVLGLRDKGYDVTLVSGPTYGPEGEIESYARAMGVELIIIPELVRQVSPWKDLHCLTKLFFLIKERHFDIVHTHTSKAGIVGRCAAYFAGVPLIVHTPHGHIFHSYFSPFKTKLFRILEMTCAHFCDKIITLTDKCKQEHIQLGIAKAGKFITIHSGIKLEDFLNCSFNREEIKAKLGILRNSKVVGTVSRLEPIKGVQFLVEAMPEILDNFPYTHFLIVGDGSQKGLLEEKAKALGIENNITFTGIRNDIPQLLSIVDIFVLASLNEGMGRVIVEAGLAAKPVVATKVSGIPELVRPGVTGILVEPASQRDLAQGIRELLSSPDKAKTMGENAQEIMRENYSSQKMVEKIENLYKDLL